MHEYCTFKTMLKENQEKTLVMMKLRIIKKSITAVSIWRLYATAAVTENINKDMQNSIPEQNNFISIKYLF